MEVRVGDPLEERAHLGRRFVRVDQPQRCHPLGQSVRDRGRVLGREVRSARRPALDLLRPGRDAQHILRVAVVEQVEGAAHLVEARVAPAELPQLGPGVRRGGPGEQSQLAQLVGGPLRVARVAKLGLAARQTSGR
ncbi:MAG: hypothetical protein M3R38_35435 [Actinomycetota bacterium]|nr:hypothetical protein [Actinomycetota bacterium]